MVHCFTGTYNCLDSRVMFNLMGRRLSSAHFYLVENKMSIDLNVKKIVIIVVMLLVVSGLVYWFVATKETRAANAEYEVLVKHAQRQAVEIAIIEQSSKLQDYRQQLAKMQQERQTIAPIPPMPAPFMPAIVTDPKDIVEE